MKVNLTKKHIDDLEKAVKIIKECGTYASGKSKKEVKDIALSLEDILVRHDNRLEKEY